MTKTSQKIARDFGLMCAFLEFAPDITEEERGDILYKEFIKRTGLNISKEQLARILDEERKREYEILENDTIYIKSNIVDEFDIGEKEQPTWKVKVGNFKN